MATLWMVERSSAVVVERWDDGVEVEVASGRCVELQQLVTASAAAASLTRRWGGCRRGGRRGEVVGTC